MRARASSMNRPTASAIDMMRPEMLPRASHCRTNSEDASHDVRSSPLRMISPPIVPCTQIGQRQRR
jgi:hypothetical protein